MFSRVNKLGNNFVRNIGWQALFAADLNAVLRMLIQKINVSRAGNIGNAWAN